MSDRVVILGGHGKIALLTAPKLAAAGFTVDSVIRNPDQAPDVEAAGANPVVLDIETADVDALAEVIAGARAVVFSAGAGGGSPERTKAVDHDAATRAIDASEQAGVKRFIMVSYARAGVDVDRLDPADSFYPYAEAKHAADAHLRQSALDYTILGPGRLTLDASQGALVRADERGQIEGRAPAEGQNVTARELVADVITYVIAEDAAVGETVNFFDGATPIAEALN